MQTPCRILALDGGGVHVLGQVVMLSRIFAKYPGLFDRIDVFAGTSAGALLALALAEKGELGLAIFSPSRIASMFQRSYSYKVWPSEGVTAAKYTNRAMEQFLTDEFGTLTVATMERQVFVPAFKLSREPDVTGAAPGRWHPRFFTNIGDESQSDLVKDVALRTTAAPTYFPIYQNYIDGGVTANNPSALAVTHCKQKGHALARISVLSLSGGCQAGSITEESAKWGAYQWMGPIVDLLIDSNMYTANALCRELLGERYCRYELALPENVPLDGIDQLETVLKAAQEANLQPVYDWIEKNWM
jgi:patatin-like phospholipase/acyl hydrolase